MGKKSKKGSADSGHAKSKVEMDGPGASFVVQEMLELAKSLKAAKRAGGDTDDDFEEFEDFDFDDIPPQVDVMQMAHAKGLPLPEYKSEEASGLDLPAAVPENAPMTLAPGARALVPTGLRMSIPLGMEGQVRPRSGLALKHGVTVLNAPGTIDSDYEGELQVLLINLGTEPFTIARGDRIAQLVFAQVIHVDLIDDDDLDLDFLGGRGDGGFGSTGTD